MSNLVTKQSDGKTQDDEIKDNKDDDVKAKCNSNDK